MLLSGWLWGDFGHWYCGMCCTFHDITIAMCRLQSHPIHGEQPAVV